MFDESSELSVRSFCPRRVSAPGVLLRSFLAYSQLERHGRRQRRLRRQRQSARMRLAQQPDVGTSF